MKLILLVCCLFIINVHASDLAKEQRWADETVDSILDGEAVWLNADGIKFLSIYTAAEEESTKGIIVVHGTGIHPNWEQVVKPVRVEMTTHGWNSLSIQVPILPNDATYEDYVPLYPEVPARLKAAEDYLISQGVKQIIIVAHSQGSTMSAYYLANNKHKVSAFIAIGMQSTQKDEAINAANSLQKINIPVLDIYGSEDLPGVLKTAQKRKTAAAHNRDFQQQVIAGAEHFFDGKNAELLEAINAWLKLSGY